MSGAGLSPGDFIVWKSSNSGWWLWRGVRVDGRHVSGDAWTRFGARFAAKAAVGSRHGE